MSKNTMRDLHRMLFLEPPDDMEDTPEKVLDTGVVFDTAADANLQVLSCYLGDGGVIHIDLG